MNYSSPKYFIITGHNLHTFGQIFIPVIGQTMTTQPVHLVILSDEFQPMGLYYFLAEIGPLYHFNHGANFFICSTFKL